MWQRLPALLNGLIVGSYWLSVLWMVRQLRRSAGRDANLIPRERTGRRLRLIWVPVVVLWIALPITVGLSRPHPWILKALPHSPVMGWIAVAVALAAFAATLVCWKQMGQSWRMGINPAEKTELVVGGAYRYVRHPIYALSSLLMLSTMAAAPAPLMLAVGAAHLVLLQWEARREEAHLLTVHGPAYEQYRSRVGRFFPRMRCVMKGREKG